jgi:hypothetical protein
MRNLPVLARAQYASPPPDEGGASEDLGDSRSAAPNVGVTFSSYEVGVSLGRGRFIAAG